MICDQGRFAGSGPADDVGMVPAAGVLDAKAFLLVAEVGLA
jgi:hypothetical protein